MVTDCLSLVYTRNDHASSREWNKSHTQAHQKMPHTRKGEAPGKIKSEWLTDILLERARDLKAFLPLKPPVGSHMWA